MNRMSDADGSQKSYDRLKEGAGGDQINTPKSTLDVRERIPENGPSFDSTVPREEEELDESEQYKKSYDDLLTELGGFGRFQFFLFFSMLCCFVGVNFFIYNISFFELEPEHYTCVYTDSPNPVPCTPSTFCGDPNLVSYEVDYSDGKTLQNWATKMDFACASDWKIGAIGSA